MQVGDCGGYADHPAVRSREDWELYLHLAAAGRQVVFVPLVFGIYHDLPGLDDQGVGRRARPRRAGTSAGCSTSWARGGRLPLNTRHLRYHPDVGYI